VRVCRLYYDCYVNIRRETCPLTRREERVCVCVCVCVRERESMALQQYFPTPIDSKFPTATDVKITIELTQVLHHYNLYGTYGCVCVHMCM